MISGRAGFKAGVLVGLMVAFILWAHVAIAGVNEDLLTATERGDLSAVKAFIDKGADVNAKAKDGRNRR